eukprot:CAMPEP_0194086662 /NCGR_PEP_ID=MMETSP0149-20130528/21987_1 /TAXON_ID=122233 /ORGANISM="Chaetoceros debilis, Strain MM31A-1" /LENGTH=290 /DNA_ID=CAMNT_0038769801 /DNA_START=279 /DNA_END=1151 /DNA_ORIENTATION=+
MYFDFADDPILIEQNKYDNLLTNTIPSTMLQIARSTVGHGHGLYCRSSVSAGSTICTIPLEKCITLEDVRSHPELGRVLGIMQDDLEEEEGPTASMAAYLASEMLREQCAEWEEDPSLSGPHADYINILPTGRAVSQQDHVLWWSDEDVERLFEGGAAYEKALALREWVKAEGEIIEGMLVSNLAEKQMGLSVSQVRGAVTNAFVNVLNRSLYLGDGEENMLLVPVLDMAAHSIEPNIKANLGRNEMGIPAVIVTAARDVSESEELTLNCYSTLFEGHEFYVMYGFIDSP